MGDALFLIFVRVLELIDGVGLMISLVSF